MPNQNANERAQQEAQRQQAMELARAISSGDEDRAAMGRLQKVQADNLTAILDILNNRVLPSLTRIETKLVTGGTP